MTEGRIQKISGPLVIAEGMRDANMFDVVRVGEQQLIGEIIEIHGDRASIQVYEETAGLGRGDRVVSTGAPLSASRFQMVRFGLLSFSKTMVLSLPGNNST